MLDVVDQIDDGAPLREEVRDGADPDEAAASTPITLTTWDGWPTGLTLIYLVAWNGVPSFDRVGPFGTFDAAGVRTLGGPTPPGLSGSVATFQAYGFISATKVGASNREVVTFL